MGRFAMAVRSVLFGMVLLSSALAWGVSPTVQISDFYNSSEKPAWLNSEAEAQAKCTVTADNFEVPYADYVSNNSGNQNFLDNWTFTRQTWNGGEFHIRPSMLVEPYTLWFGGGCCSLFGERDEHQLTRHLNTSGADYIGAFIEWRSTQMGLGKWNFRVISSGAPDPLLEFAYSPSSRFFTWLGIPTHHAHSNMAIEFNNYIPASNADMFHVYDVRVYQCVKNLPVHHFRISHSGHAVTCEGGVVNISPRDSIGGLTVPAAGSTLNLQARNVAGGALVNGYWVKESGSGTLSDPNQTDGRAVYTFGSNDTTPSFRFHTQSAVLLNYNVAAGPVTEHSSYDPNMQFNDVGIKVVNEQGQITGKDSRIAPVSGPFRIQVVNTNTETKACESRVSGGTSLSLNVRAECLDNTDTLQSCHTSGNQLRLHTGGSNYTVGTTASALTFNFVDNAGVISAPFDLLHYYAGNYRLGFSGTLPASGSKPAVATAGLSNAYIARPFALNVKRIYAGSVDNPGSLANASQADANNDGRIDANFVSAESDFNAVIEAVAWQASDDTNNDGIADAGANLNDNTVLITEGLNAATFSATNPTPAVGTIGTLSRQTMVMSDPDTALATLNYNEAGSFEMGVVLNNFMGSSYNISGNAGVVGRFFPDHFNLGGSVVKYHNRSNQAGTVNCNFAYMDQPDSFAVGLSNLQALGANGRVLSKYDTAGGAYNTRMPQWALEDNNDGVNRVARLTANASGRWVAGKFVNTNTEPGMDFYTTLTFARAATVDGPFQQMQLSLSLATLTGLDANPSTTGNCSSTNSCTTKGLGAAQRLELFYGVLYMPGAAGHSSSNLTMPLELRYIDGSSGFHYRHNDESCLYSTASSFWSADASLTGALATKTALINGLPRPAVTFNAGLSNEIVLTAPNEAGEVDVLLTPLADWLKFDWNGDGNATGPTGKATFSIFSRGHDKVIYWKED